jgi:Ran GTPase-activating protein (RanGAP) involved in mRNA processing and transport
LSYLSLSDNKITSVGAKQVALLIQKCDSLTELYLANNEIDNEGVKVLVKAIKNRPDFKNIDLDNNKFSGDTITELFSILPLSKINLTKNVLTEQQVTPLS